MKCALCAGALSAQEVTEEIVANNNHLMVKVMAEVCINCHERYYASGVVDRLIELKDKLGHKTLKNMHQIGKVYKLA